MYYTASCPDCGEHFTFYDTSKKDRAYSEKDTIIDTVMRGSGRWIGVRKCWRCKTLLAVIYYRGYFGSFSSAYSITEKHEHGKKIAKRVFDILEEQH